MKKKKPRKSKKVKPSSPVFLCEVCQKPLAASHSIMPHCVHPECAYKGFFDAVQKAFWKYYPWILMRAAIPIGGALFAMAKQEHATSKKGRPKKKR